MHEEFRAQAARLGALSRDDLRRELAEQAKTLRFAAIDIGATWEIGVLIRTTADYLGLPIAVDVTLGQQTVFHAALPGATAENDAWARRKGAVADRYLDSSLAVGLSYEGGPDGFDARSRLPIEEFAAHGGAFPLLLETGVWVGHVAVSGLPAIDDHALVVCALERVLRSSPVRVA